MEPTDRIAQIKALRAEQENNADIERAKFVDQRDMKAITLFHSIANKFAQYADENDYEGMSIRTYSGQEYFTHRLYDVAVGDGEVYYRSTPLSIAIDGNGDISYFCEGEPSGYPLHRLPSEKSAEPIEMNVAKTLEDYKSRPSESSLPYSQRHATYSTETMMDWASHMVHFIYSDTQRKQGKRGLLNLNEEAERHAIRDKLIADNFPDGFRYFEYMRKRVAGYVLSAEDYMA